MDAPNEEPAEELPPPPPAKEELEDTPRPPPGPLPIQQLPCQDNWVIKRISANGMVPYQFDTISPQEAISHVARGTDIDLFDFGTILMYRNKIFAKVHPNISRDATIKSLGFLNQHHIWVINELSRQISTIDAS